MDESNQKISPKSRGGGQVRGINCFPMEGGGGGLKAWFPLLEGGVDRWQIRASNEEFRLEKNQKAI